MTIKREILELRDKYLLPKDEKWKNICSSFYLVYFFSQLLFYFIGRTEIWASKIVFYMWKVNPFGIFADVIPYKCPYGLCDAPRGLENVVSKLQFSNVDLHIWGLVMFLIGGFITVRIFVLCFNSLENSLGIDFISRTIEKFLPEKKK